MHQRQGFITLLVFLVGVALLYFVVWDSFNSVTKTYRDWQDVKKEKESTIELVNLTPQLSARLEKFTKGALLLLQATPSPLQESDYISLLSSVATQSGNVLSAVRIALPDAKTGDLPVEIGVVGTITTLGKLLQVMQRTVPFMDIEQFQAKGDTGLQDFILKLKSYTFIAPPASDAMSAQQRIAAIQRALSSSVDLLKDDSFKTFKTGGGFPSPSPTKEEVGRDNPFGSEK